MKLDLREYTDPQEVLDRGNKIVDTWRLMQRFDRADVTGDVAFLEALSDEHYRWLEKHAPWFIGTVDHAIARMLASG